MDPTYPLVPIANFIACALVVIPLIHLVTRSWNTGVYVFALWTFLSSLSYAVNTIVWADDDTDRAPVWCDICKRAVQMLEYRRRLTCRLIKASHLQILVNIGRPACSLIITRRLYKITRLQDAIISKRQVSRHLLVNCRDRKADSIRFCRGALSYPWNSFYVSGSLSS